MNINPSSDKQAVSANPLNTHQAGSATTKRVQEQNTSSVLNSENGTENRASEDTLSLSSASLNLAKSSTDQPTNRPSRIEEPEQARKLAGQLISDIRDQTTQAKAVLGHINSSQTRSLLA